MNFRKKILVLILLFQAYNSNYILPLYTTTISINESIIKKDYLSKIYSSHLYTNLIIGSNKQEIKGIINMTEIGFFIYENAYDYNSSSSFNIDLSSQNSKGGYLSNDTLCLIPFEQKQDIYNLNIRKCNNFDKVNFSLLKKKQKDIEENIYDKYAILGLQQTDSQNKYIPLFIKSLKNTDMINSHTFSFNYLNNTKNGEIQGHLLLGDEDYDLDNGKLKRTLSNSRSGQLFWNLVFRKVTVGVNDDFDTSSDNHLKTFDTKESQIIGDLPYIIGINEYKNYIRNVFFNDLLSKDICTYKNVSINDDYATFVCDSKSDLFIQKMKNSFPKLYFQHHELNKTFILDEYDLFSYNTEDKNDKNIYFLVFFTNKNDPYRSPEFPGGAIIKRWKLGIPFLKKYKLSFNGDSRIITYYETFNYNNNTNNNMTKNGVDILNKNNNNSIIIKIIIIGALLIIFFILGILFHKNIIRLPRKKKANELEDDYDYTINPNSFDEKKAHMNNYEVSN